MNTVANSAVTYDPNFTAQTANGLSTIVWGTDGINPGVTGYIVVSASESHRVEEITIENGTGFEAVVILLNKGLDVEINVIHDESVIPLGIGDVATLSTPYGSVPMIMLGEKSDQARKREGMKTFTFKSYNSITLV